jgi:hypothetical protein
VTNSANNSPNTQDLFTRQKQTWASIPPHIQETFLRNIRDTIKARVEQAHGVQEERVHAYDDDWEAVAAELESRVSNQTSAQPVPRRNERHNLALETNWERGNQSQETDTSFNYSQSSIARTLGRLESDLASQDSGVLAVGPTPNSQMSPSLSLCLSLGLEESQEVEESAAWINDRQPDHDDCGPNGSVTSGN